MKTPFYFGPAKKVNLLFSLVLLLFSQFSIAQTISYKDVSVNILSRLDTINPTITGTFSGKIAPKNYKVVNYLNNGESYAHAPQIKDIKVDNKGRLIIATAKAGIISKPLNLNSDFLYPESNLTHIQSILINPVNNDIYYDNVFKKMKSTNNYTTEHSIKKVVKGSSKATGLKYWGGDKGYNENATNFIRDMVMDSLQNIYFVGDGNEIRMIKASDKNAISYSGNNLEGYVNGSLRDARFRNPGGITIHPTTGDIYVSDTYNHVIRKIDIRTRIVSTYVGDPNISIVTNGSLSNATFCLPTKLSFDNDGNLYVLELVDFVNNQYKIRKISASGNVSTLTWLDEETRDSETFYHSPLESTNVNLAVDKNSGDVYVSRRNKVFRIFSTKFNISPALPLWNLQFNILTGAISGYTPQDTLRKTYTITGYTDTDSVKTNMTLRFINSPLGLSTDSVNNINASSATCYGTIKDYSQTNRYLAGFEYSIDSSFSNYNIVNVDVKDSLVIASLQYRLRDSTKYYYRLALMKNLDGSTLTKGAVKSFITKNGKSTLGATTAATDIGYTKALLGGILTEIKPDTTFYTGVLFGTSTNTMISETVNYDKNGYGLGAFTTELKGLKSGTTYYAVAYSYNRNGIAYATDTVSFTTLTEPTPVPPRIINSFENVGANSVLLKSEITSEGKGVGSSSSSIATIIERGFLISNSDATNALNYTPDAYFNANWRNTTIFQIKCPVNNTGIYDSLFTQLASNTRYYMRAYAISNVSSSIGYGPTVSFTTTSKTSTPFMGDPIAIPGRIEAERFDEGDEGVAYHEVTTINDPRAEENQGLADSRKWDFANLAKAEKFRSTSADVEVTGDNYLNYLSNANEIAKTGYQVCFATAGEWLKYTVDVKEKETKKYKFIIRASNAADTVSINAVSSKCSIEVDGIDVTGSIVINPTGGWGKYTNTVIDSISLSPGQHEIKLKMLENGTLKTGTWQLISGAWKYVIIGTATSNAVANFNYIEIEKYNPNKTPTKFLNLNLNFNIGDNIRTAIRTAVVRARGLKPFSIFKIWMHSTPTLLASGVTDANGAFEQLISIDENTVPGKHSIDVVAVDEDGTSIAESAYIVVNNIGVVTDIVNEELGNRPATDIDLLYDDNIDTDTANTFIGQLSAIDRAGDYHVYTLASGLGDADNALFSIQSDSLILKSVADYESRTTYKIRVRAIDNADNVFDKEMTVVLKNNTKEPAAIKSNGGLSTATIRMAENNDSVTVVLAYDPKDLSQRYLYDIKSSDDSSFFRIDKLSGKLSFINKPDFEQPQDFGSDNSYKVIVQAMNLNDSSLKYIQTLIVNVYDTVDLASVLMPTVTNINAKTANIISGASNAGWPIIEKGIIYSNKASNMDPLKDDIDVTKIISDTTSGAFQIELGDLIPSSNYVIKSFITNGAGSVYSNSITFTTQDLSTLPTITYDSPVVISQNSQVNILPIINGDSLPNNAYKNVQTIAGSGIAGAKNDSLFLASLNAPQGMVFNDKRDLIVADAGNNLIRKIGRDSLVTTISGTVAGYNNEDENGVEKVSAKFNNPVSVAIDRIGNIFVADKGNNQIRKIDSTGKVFRIAGGDVTNVGANAGHIDGIGKNALFNSPEGIYLDDNNYVLYVADRGNNVIRKIDLYSNQVYTYAGNGNASSVDNLNAINASFNEPVAITFNNNGDLVVSEISGNKIRLINNLTNQVTTVASSLSSPAGVAVDNIGNIYFAESSSHKIKIIDTAGIVSVFVGSGTAGATDGIGAASSFNSPFGLLIDNYDGSLLVSHNSNTSSIGNKIRKVGLTGFMLMDSLPTGLTFNGNTGEITNFTSVIRSARDYRILYHSLIDSDTATLNLEVIANSHKLSYASPLTLKTVFQISPIVPVVEGPAFAGNSDGVIYSVSPSLPSGLTINSQTGIISGTPLEVIALKKYIITAWDGILKTSASLMIEVELGAVNPTMSFANITKTYGDNTFTLAATSNSTGDINYTSSDTNVATMSGNTVTIIGAGTATITATQAEAIGYFEGTASSTLTVGKATLIVTAADAARCYAATDPSLTVSYAGFKLEDNAASLTTKPIVSTDAVNTSVAGDYKTIATGAAATNYDFVYVDGKFTVNPLPIGTITSSVDYVCDGATLALNIAGGSNYIWYKGGTVIADATGTSVVVNSKGDYTAKLISALGCEAMSTNTLAIKQYYAPTADFTSQYYCINKPVYMTNKSTSATAGPVKYLWEDGAGYTSTATSPTFTYTSTGNKTIKLTVTPDYCPALKQTVSKVIAIEAPTAPVRLATQDAIVREAFQLNTRSITTATSYVWAPSIYLLDARVLAPTAVIEKETNFTLLTTVASNCTTTDSLLVRVFTESDIHLPTVFSPNGDGLNDKLQLNFALVENLQWFRVYDRFNTLVFETKDKLGSWDGTFNNSGTPLPVDTYFWVVSGTDNNGKAINKTGAIVLSK